MRRIVKKRSHISDSQVYTFVRLTRYILIAIGFFLAISSLGITFDKLALIGGALGVGIGFGLQNIVSNFVSGIIILFEKSMRIGDFVELETGLLGELREINIRSTLIRTPDNADILVPNTQFVTSQVNNWTLSDDLRRFGIPFGVAYGSDPGQVVSLYNLAIHKALTDNNIEIPFPQRDLHIRSGYRDEPRQQHRDPLAAFTG